MKQYRQAHWQFVGIILLLVGLLFFSVIYAVTLGSVPISAGEVYKIILAQITGNSQSLTTAAGWYDIVWLVRLPRVLLATAVGAALALSGTVMQALVRNPLADPYILGISSGASLGATLAIMLGIGLSLGSNYVGIAAFLGALTTALLVLLLGSSRSYSDISKLLLVGVALSSLCSSLSSFIVFTAGKREGMQTLNFWLLGSLASANWSLVKVLLPLVFIVCCYFCLQARILNLMVLGDETARTLGRENHLFRIIYIVLISVLIGFVVYACGLIGFVGLVVPHVARILVGSDHRRMVAVTILLGALFLLWADVLSRLLIKGAEIPIGIIVSVIGAPYFLYLVMKNARKRQGGHRR